VLWHNTPVCTGNSVDIPCFIRSTDEHGVYLVVTTRRYPNLTRSKFRFQIVLRLQSLSSHISPARSRSGNLSRHHTYCLIPRCSVQRFPRRQTGLQPASFFSLQLEWPEATFLRLSEPYPLEVERVEAKERGRKPFETWHPARREQCLALSCRT
jgi:hypothetical protein